MARIGKQDERNRKRKSYLKIYMSDDEYIQVRNMYKKSGFTTFSSFGREMILKDKIVNRDTEAEALVKIYKQLSGCSNNINQVARRVNVSDKVTKSDIEELKKEVKKIWQLLRY